MKKFTIIILSACLVLLLSSCWESGPTCYEKEGLVHVKGSTFKFGDYDVKYPHSDPATFQMLDNNATYCKDKNHVYYKSFPIQRITILTDADPTTFEVLKDWYSKDSVYVWWQDSLLPDITSKNFQVLGDGYAITDSIVLRYNSKIDGIDPNTIIVHNYEYIEDKNDVYWECEPLHVSDIKSFTPVKKEGVLDFWAKDKDFVYYLGYHERDKDIVRCRIADYKSFEPISNDYARDKHNVYVHDTLLQGADPSSFKVLNHYYARDNKQVFCEKTRVCDYSRKFRIIDGSYATDGTYVYYQAIKLPHADPSSFHVMHRYWAKDKNQVYYEDAIIEGADVNSFKILEAGFSRDKNQVFDEDKKVEGADAESFVVTYCHKGRDKYREYITK